jgi:GNAT superfamily N-acetyltransferase
MDKDFLIRPYQAGDRAAVREISWQTAFRGESADAYFVGKEIFQDFLTQYFTDEEPQSSFVADAGGEVVGYIIGATNTRRVARFYNRQMPFFIFRAFARGIFFNRKSGAFVFSCVRSFFKGEFRQPDFSREYPATLHINLKEGHRGGRIGAGLIADYLEYLKKERIPGVHFATISEQACHFFKKQGFALVFEGKRSYFRFFLGKDIPVYIFAKKIV